ncbi:MAG: M20/M25/M40 family metallo-hydrolase [Bacteroidetes bacterium]|nr:M20/M25/M40 family metallo-hydrolase [Bacteroidota bacterium]
MLRFALFPRSASMRAGILLLGAFLSVFHTLKAQKAEIEQILHEVNLDSLLFSVKQLTGIEPVLIHGQPQIIYSRYKTQTPNAWAAMYLHDRMQAYGYETSYENFEATGQNIIALKKGTLYPEKIFLMCAHYDAIALPYDHATGADDNGSGCAAVLEAGRLLKDLSLPFSIMFVFFDEEEQGFIGSNHFVQNFNFKQTEIRATFNLDMIAYDDNHDFKASINTRDYGNSVELANKIIGLNDTFQIGLNLNILNPGSTSSDHESFWEYNKTAVFLAEDDKDFNRYWHTKYDSITYFNDSFFYRNTQFAIASMLWFASNKYNDLAVQSINKVPVFQAFPNPAKAQFTVYTESNGILEIYQLDGKQIHTQEIINGNNPIQIDVGNKPRNILLRFMNESGSIQSKWLLLIP